MWLRLILVLLLITGKKWVGRVIQANRVAYLMQNQLLFDNKMKTAQSTFVHLVYYNLKNILYRKSN